VDILNKILPDLPADMFWHFIFQYHLHLW